MYSNLYAIRTDQIWEIKKAFEYSGSLKSKTPQQMYVFSSVLTDMNVYQ